MRLIRGHSSNKENLGTPVVHNSNLTEVEQLKMELKYAYSQINSLKSNNRELLCKA